MAKWAVLRSFGVAGAYFGQMMGGKDHVFAVNGEKDPVQCIEEGEEIVERDAIDEQHGECETGNIQQRKRRTFTHESCLFAERHM